MSDIYEELSREQLIALLNDYSKNWLALDGLWFQAVEKRWGMDLAMECDIEMWEQFTVIEARRIKKFLGLPEQGGLDGLEKALKLRFYGNLNKDEYIREGNTLKYRMLECRVQSARERKGMEFHPCKRVGIPEYGLFAKAIDDRISCECISCYPDITETDCHCSWLFTLEEIAEE
ncbi:MAG: hypothetical protein GX975_03795 [Clostridiales bacterium]|nr:hypothetical protein [Clostridiales bacterium]